MEFTGQKGKVWTLHEDRPVAPPGGFGQVFLGTGPDDDQVAIKRVDIYPGPPLPQGREVEIGDRLRGSPHCVQQFDSYRDEEHLYIVMELADGALSGLPFPEDQVLAVMRDVTLGLQELHGEGVFHRDLKPANVLRFGNVWKVADFGLARFADVGTQVPTWKGGGTWEYMAPELFERGSANVRTDLYALGCMLFEVITGRLPFVTEPRDPEKLYHLHKSAEIPELPPDTHAVLRSLVARLLAKSPSDRQSDAGAVLARLDRIALRPNSEQVRLQELAAVVDEKRSKEEAAAAARRAQREAIIAQGDTVAADFHEILDDALADAEQAVPEIKAGPWDRGERKIELPGCSVVVKHGADRRQTVYSFVDSIVAVGEIELRHEKVNWKLANFVCKPVDGENQWMIYRFRRGAFVGGNYREGPLDRNHGLARGEFYDPANEGPMRGQGIHIWRREVAEKLTPEGIVALFVEAIEYVAHKT